MKSSFDEVGRYLMKLNFELNSKPKQIVLRFHDSIWDEKLVATLAWLARDILMNIYDSMMRELHWMATI